MQSRAHLTGCLVAAALLALAAIVTHAGPLDPPAGAIAPTHKTLTEVEPRIAINAANTPGDGNSIFRITQPGSYYLTGNVTGVPSEHGIEIAASGVTIDLNGFELVGVVSSLDGIGISGNNPINLSIFNGSIRNWGQDGIDLRTITTRACRLADLSVSGNGGSGISAGNDTVIVRCAANANGGSGIRAAGACTVQECVANLNTLSGFDLEVANTISACVARQNVQSGIKANSTIIDRCTVSDNGVDGILVASACIVTSNLARFNGQGAAGGAGIHVTGADNRLEGNTCSGPSQDRGIDVDVSGNIIVRNTCAGNVMNWQVAAGNLCLVIAGNNCTAFSGNSGGTQIGSTDPWANFTY